MCPNLSNLSEEEYINFSKLSITKPVIAVSILCSNKALCGFLNDPGKYRIMICFETQTAFVNPLKQRPAWH